jgi:NADPH:quinone reductase-like Zn-dependent oxidoreductase
MKAALFREKDTPLLIADVPGPIPAKDQVLIRIDTAALNHRDLWIIRWVHSQTFRRHAHDE